MRPGIIIDVTAADRPARGHRGGPQQPSEARLARRHRARHGRWAWRERGHASDSQEQDCRVALAGALRRRRGRGLLRNKTRPSRIAPFGPEVGERIIALTLAEPPGETTHWTGRAMAKAAGVSLSYVQRVWRSHGLQPHRIRTFKLSNDPHFATKVRDIVGLYVDPPAHAVVLSIDEKSQIQALDRTQPSLPLKRGRAGTMTHDYKRHGTTTLFAALDVLDGRVVGRCMQRHRHQEFIRFLNAVEKTVPASKAMHVILDNYAAHKHPKVITWLARHPQVTFHFTPTSASWLNAVEGFFATLNKRRLRRGTFLGVVDLQASINRYLRRIQRRPETLPMAGDPDTIIAAQHAGTRRWIQSTSNNPQTRPELR